MKPCNVAAVLSKTDLKAFSCIFNTGSLSQSCERILPKCGNILSWLLQSGVVCLFVLAKRHTKQKNPQYLIDMSYQVLLDRPKSGERGWKIKENDAQD